MRPKSESSASNMKWAPPEARTASWTLDPGPWTQGPLPHCCPRQACEAARQKGCKVIHSPIIFAADKSDNPNKGLGILKGCADGELFLEGTWNAEICDPMKPKEGDLVLKGVPPAVEPTLPYCYTPTPAPDHPVPVLKSTHGFAAALRVP